MIFQIKKVKIETLSEYLVAARKELRLSLDEVVKTTGIASRFLKCLESANFGQLPADVYVIGFLKQLAQIYRVPVSSLIDQFKKERGIEQQVEIAQAKPQSKFQSYFSQLVITPKLMSVLGGSLLVFLTIGYVVWQIISLNTTPSLEILEPHNNQAVTASFVSVKGATDVGTAVTINNEPVFVNSGGKFETTLGVAPGQKELVFEAKNKFDKILQKRILLVVQPQLTGATENPTSSGTEPMRLELKFAKSATISVIVDGVNLPQETISAGSSKLIKATNKILLSTSDAGGTQGYLNGKSLGKLGRDGETLQNIPFSADEALILVNTKDSAKVTN